MRYSESQMQRVRDDRDYYRAEVEKQRGIIEMLQAQIKMRNVDIYVHNAKEFINGNTL